jgi:formylglycine-generating enzyme required for sulfatase activity
MRKSILLSAALIPLSLIFIFSTGPANRYMKDPKGYAFVPMGTLINNGKTVSCQAFYIKKTEVTNEEYKVFLNDLKKQGKMDEYKIAYPDSTKWLNRNAYMQPYMEFYFSHPAYDNYPVVNISRQGAILYCKWLTEKFNAKIKNKNKYFNDFRLPCAEEWMLAAKGGHNDAIYPWESKATVDADGNYFCNFKYLESPDAKKTKTNLESGISPAIVSHFKPNDYGIYDMAGNVAEMVQVYGDSTSVSIGTKGGSFVDDESHIKIDGPDAYKGITDASPFIGFRPVTTYYYPNLKSK